MKDNRDNTRILTEFHDEEDSTSILTDLKGGIYTPNDDWFVGKSSEVMLVGTAIQSKKEFTRNDGESRNPEKPGLKHKRSEFWDVKQVHQNLRISVMLLTSFSGKRGLMQPHRQNTHFQTSTSPSTVLIFTSSATTFICRFCTARHLIKPSKNVDTSRTKNLVRYSCSCALLGHDILMIPEFCWITSICLIRRVGNGLSKCNQ